MLLHAFVVLLFNKHRIFKELKLFIRVHFIAIFFKHLKGKSCKIYKSLYLRAHTKVGQNQRVLLHILDQYKSILFKTQSRGSTKYVCTVDYCFESLEFFIMIFLHDFLFENFLFIFGNNLYAPFLRLFEKEF